MLQRKELIFRFVKYSFVGIISTCIYFLAIFVLIEKINVEPVLGSAWAFIIMTFFSFFLNVRYTFGSKIDHKKILRFSLVSVVGFFLNFVLIYLVVHILQLHYLIGEFVTILVIPTVNFLLNNYWTFQRGV